MESLREKEGYLCDMDGVIYYGNQLLPGAFEFVDWLKREDKKYLFLTNGSGKTRKELQQKLLHLGLEVEEDHFYTSALATAKFVSSQKPNGSAYVIGDPGVYLALSDVGIINNPIDPDFVIVGETSNYNYDSLCHAVDLVNKGARLIGTNTDLTCPVENGIVPACKALISPIEKATGKKAYFVGKPNPLMMRTGLRILGVHSQDAAIIGDRMDTDIIAGVESGLDTCLVLSGCTSREEIGQHPFRPRLVINGVGDIVA